MTPEEREAFRLTMIPVAQFVVQDVLTKIVTSELARKEVENAGDEDFGMYPSAAETIRPVSREPFIDDADEEGFLTKVEEMVVPYEPVRDMPPAEVQQPWV